jgi:ribonuclease HI
VNNNNTIQKAELLAVKEALEIEQKSVNLEIRTDSMYVVNIFTDSGLRDWKKKGVLHKKKNVELNTQIQELDSTKIRLR